MVAELRVLVGDDREDIATSLLAWLKLEGHEGRIALDGKQALAIARGFGPSCMLLDISMPGMDGRDVARQLRTTYGAGLVLIAITGWQDSALRTTGVFADFDYYLRKPIDLDLLAKILSPD
jgi:DNA-binding response OmpR family regulator